ncbi:sensor histidine kinase [Caproiciproducens sp. MSJ-32]|uniref:sensor histidine kinase n=1 Tax=Caproiciproducens sp. MSJ-32 TaxID=2841527 RepID=UPI001C0F812E|nr:HAMP domain-containing sensor histidine kinase [Caproiciproducens sp. MSJ-32]MBU5454714.1 HAMP domain-containing histidine kinase [Caproiciproducens sp. MSJ-32]
MKKKSVINRFLIAFSSITLIILMIIGAIISTWFSICYSNQKKELLNKHIELMESYIAEIFDENSDFAYNKLKNSMEVLSISLNMDTIILDRQAYVYAVSNDEFSYLKYNKLELEDIDLKELTSEEIVESEFIDKNKEKKKSYIKALVNKQDLLGYIYVIENNKPLTYIKNLYYIIWILLAIAFILISSVSFYIAKKTIKTPIKKINNAAQKISKGEVQKRIYIDSKDEIGELAESFNTMAESIERADIVRRDFISNVSHELRSPITSIKGFITGIIDGVIPKDKENYYLNIVNDEIQRLSRLVNDLLDISSLESGKFNLNIVCIDINEIITLCILNLERKIKEKNMNVEVLFSNSHEYCIADRDRIIQVVTNLLENAIKYGDNDGKIKIETYPKGNLVYVSVFNTGPIIEKENLNKIWERFYKNDKSRTNKISTGLGLPIVRLILSQHNQDISVENVEDKGVKFTFTLARQNDQ